MEEAQIQVIARDLLGLSLTGEEAASLVAPLAGLRQLVALTERVPLPFDAQPFITPGMGERWLEAWPDRPPVPSGDAA